jgi:hypothetical protein
VVRVPSGTVSGTISVKVGGSTVTSVFNETVIPVPIISSVSPHAAQAGTTVIVVVKGANLANATFSFSPAGLAVNSATISADGTSAILSVTATANANGRFAAVADNGVTNSGGVVTAVNALGVFTDPNADPDNDGLANAYELILGTDPFNPDTDGDGFSDGAEVASGSDPLNPLCTPLTCRVSGEHESPPFSVTNTGFTTAVSGESESQPFSALNVAVTGNSRAESDSLPFSVAMVAAPNQVSVESDSVPFSVVNALSTTLLPSEADSVPLSVCNSLGPCSNSSPLLITSRSLSEKCRFGR